MITKNELQSSLGLLLYIAKCVKPARYFLNRMLQLLRDNTDNNHICLTSNFLKTLNGFRFSLVHTMESPFTTNPHFISEFIWMLHWKVWEVVMIIW